VIDGSGEVTDDCIMKMPQADAGALIMNLDDE